ncbi:MAG: ABC transporter permease [Actinobacteria bacterium]|nr:ABC transporter permease [Actinomycetota bacterium]
MTEERRRSIPTTIFVLIALVFLFLPLVIVVLFSFQSTGSVVFPFHGFSLRWYKTVFESEEFLEAVATSLKIAAIASLLTVVFGTAASYGISRSRFKLRWLVALLMVIPLSLPGLFIGASLLSFFDQTGVQLSTTTVLAGHLVYLLPFYIIIVRAAFDRADPLLEEAGADLGASPWRVFTRVLLPRVWPVIAGTACLMFALSLDEFVITFFVIGDEPTLPLFIWSRLRETVDPSINVISTLLLLTTLALGVVALLIGMRSARRRNPAIEGGPFADE